VSLILSDKDEDKEWGAWILKNDKKKLSVRINTPPTCYVGIWKFQVETIQKRVPFGGVGLSPEKILLELWNNSIVLEVLPP
jgi:hypothetical protein